MTIGAISSNPQAAAGPDAGTTAASAALQSLASNYNALGQALQAGDLATAQSAFTALIQGVAGGGGASAGASSATGPSASPSASVGADLVSLGQALQSGNLPAAQQAFNSLQQAIQAHGAGRGQHHGGGDGGEAGGAGASSGPSGTITNQVTTPNPDGTVTITTTYADGSTVTTTEASPAPVAAQSPLDPGNPAQFGVLLSAQEQSTR